MRRLGKILLVILASIGSLVVALIGFATWFALQDQDQPLPERMVLTIDLDRGVSEAKPDGLLAHLEFNGTYILRDVIDALDRAAGDPRVVGVMATLGDAPIGIAMSQELRQAILDFRKSGKPALFFGHTIGEMGGGTVDYYLATAFSRLWLQPSGDVGITGFLAETPFLKNTLDMLGIQPQFASRHEYKTALESLTATQYSEANAEQIKALLDSWMTQVVDGIATERKLSPEQVRGLINNAPLLSGDALQAGLIDRLGYRDEAEDEALAQGGEFIDFADYAARSASPIENASKVALIHAIGAIMRGESDGGGGPVPTEAIIGSETLARHISDAVDDPDIRAIVLRIDSPGGSYVASDTVWREIRNARDAGKPVIASMGETAASGGYFIAMAADKIVAQPGSVTGSIGVFGGKFVIDGLLQKVGISIDTLQQGDNAAIWSQVKEFSPEAWDKLNRMMDAIYDDFTAKAAEARGLSPQEMDRLARGRVWSGADAQRVGLVDELGGVTLAYELARRAAGIPDDQAAALVTYPAPRSLFEILEESLANGHAPAGLSLSGTDRDLVRLMTLARPILSRLQTSQGMLIAPNLPDPAQ